MSKQASAAIKSITMLSNTKRVDIARTLGITAQGVSDKLSRGRWSADELASVAELCGYTLAIVDNSGRVVAPIAAAISPAQNNN